MNLINDIVVKPVKVEKIISKPIKHAKLFSEAYPNIFLCAKKKSGKTSVLATILKNAVGRDTTVIAFVSTVDKDSVWLAIKKWLKNKGNPCHFYNSIKSEEGENHLADLLKELTDQNEEDEEDSKEVRRPLRMKFDNEEEEEEEKQKPTKYLAPEYIIIFDDMGGSLRVPEVNKLLKINRHLRSMVIISSQWVTDLEPQAIKQLDYSLIFRSFDNEKLEKLYKLLDLGLGFDRFTKLYTHATLKPFNFLYIDVRDESYRRNFNYKYDLIKLFSHDTVYNNNADSKTKN